MYNNKFDKPYRNIINIDTNKVADLFNLVNNMNIQDIKQYIMIENIPLSVVDTNSNNLIHAVLLNTETKTKTEQQRLNIIEYLYNENVNPNAMNSKNITPLHIACMRQYYSIVKFLIERGVDSNYMDNNGNTPFHFLLNGRIKLEEKTEAGLIIPKSKKLDTIRVEESKELRNTIWGAIRDSPYLSAISKTIENTISNSTECKENVIEFQEELLKKNLSLDRVNNMKELKELKDISINDFTSTIEKQWGNFQKIRDINIHQSTNTSWGPEINGNLAIIKDTNIDTNIENKLDYYIDKIENVLKPTDNIILVDTNAINTLIYDNKPSDDKLDEYYNVMKHPLAIDMADNIIDWDNYTFVGGSRAVGIANEIPIPFIKELMKLDCFIIVKTMAYSLFNKSYDEILTYCKNPANIDNYLLYNDKSEKDIMVRYIVEVIYDNVNLQTENDLIGKLNTLYGDYTNISHIINNRRTSNKLSWLYHFIISYMCNKNLSKSDKNNLSCNINQLLIYLISGIANNKGNDLKLSISQVVRSRLIDDEIYKGNGFSDRITKADEKDINLGSLYSGWIFTLLNENTNIEEILNHLNIGNVDMKPSIDDNIDAIIINDELKEIVKYTYNLFNNIIINYVITDNLELNKTERLCYMILQYYENMKQKPLLQNIVDTISLIRFKDTLYKYEVGINIDKTYHFLLRKRLCHLYEKPINVNIVLNYDVDILDDIKNTIHASIDSVLPWYLAKDLTETRKPIKSSLYNFFKDIGYIMPFDASKKNIKTNEVAIESYLITEYCLPSKLYFYLSKGFNYIDNIKNNLDKILINDAQQIYRDNLAIYLLKKIEASHLGLCFMGRLDNLDYSIRANNDIYFYSHNNTNPKITNEKRFFTGYVSVMANCCPPTLYQYNNLLDNNYNRVIEIQNKMNKIILKSLENMKQTKKSNTYSSVIANIYPVLNSIISIVENLNNMRNYITNLDIQNSLYNVIKDEDEIKKIFEKIEYSMLNIEDFNNNINMINSFMYLFYYMKTDTMANIKIPKFIYNMIGVKPLIAFDDNTLALGAEDTSILYPPQNINMISHDYDTADIDKNNNTNIPNIVNSSYLMVIENFNKGIFFMNKEIIEKSFVADKYTKLPPSLSNILGEFYKINTKELIVKNTALHTIFDNIPDNMIGENNLQDNILKLQKYLLGAKITEELIQIFAKLKIKQVAVFLYQSIIQKNISKIPHDIINEKLFDEINIDIDINNTINSKIIELGDNRLIKEILHNYYNPFTEKINKKNYFILYPSNYNNTNLLNSKYVVDIDTRIIEELLYNRGNIFIYNMENSSPLYMLIKQNNYPILEKIKELKYKGTNLIGVNYTQNIYSPYKYLLEQYKMHLNAFMPMDSVKENIKNFVAPQYNEVKQIIQANDSFYNNILINLELSFSICNYLTQQYLLERVVEYKYKFTPEFNTYLDNEIDLLHNPQYINGNNIYYNMNIKKLNISNDDNMILINDIFEDYIIKYDKLTKNLAEYNKEKDRLDIRYKKRYEEIEQNILKNTEERQLISKNYYILKDIYENIKYINKPYEISMDKIELIKRYNIMLQKMHYANNNYIMGWNKILDNSRDLFISRKILQEKIDITSINTTINTSIKNGLSYYEEMNNICVEYFESPRYTGNNIVGFVYNTLIHLTRTIICSSIENIIRKILFETFQTGYYNGSDEVKKFEKILRKINYFITPNIKKYLYEEVAEKFVKTSVSIYIDSNEKASYEILTVTEILHSFIDLMLSESFDKLDNNIVEVLKNNIVSYYETIVNKIILNWNVCIENMFLYMINQYRYVKMIDILG